MPRSARIVMLLLVAAVATAGCAVASEDSAPGAGIPEVTLLPATSAPTATTGPATTGTTTETSAPIDLPESGEAVIYLLAYDPEATGPSPSLVPVARPLAILDIADPDPARTTLGFLLAGPTPGEQEAAQPISSGIPEGTRLLDLSVENGIATVDLSAEFEAPAGSFSEIARLEQVLYTLTRFDEIDGVRFAIEGRPVSVFGGHGIVLADPVVRSDFDTALPAILIESPPYWSVARGPVVVEGTANVFEATVSLALVDGQGTTLWEGFATATCGTGCRGQWEATIPYQVAESQLGALVAWEASPEDGRPVNVRRHAVFLVPEEGSAEAIRAEAAEVRAGLDAALTRRDQLLQELDALEESWGAIDDAGERAALETSMEDVRALLHQVRVELSAGLERLAALGEGWLAPCTGGEAPGDLPDDPSLPGVVATTRSLLYAAARACDWASLDALLPADGFVSSFGLPGDPIGQWQREEVLGYRPMAHLAGLLAMPYGVQSNGENTYYVWPSASAAESWEGVSDAHRSVLLTLYSEYDLAQFDLFGGYYGYRIGIDQTGAWIYFVAGD